MTANGFERVHRTRSYEGIVDQVRQLVDTGKLRPGDRLPPERELARTLSVSRSTLKEAFRVLEHVGLVESKMGRGRYIAQPRSARSSTHALSDVLEHATIIDFLQVRRFLEVPMAGIAAELATPEDIARIGKTLEMPGDSEEASLRADTEFHLALAEATHNTVYLRFVSSEEFLLYRMAMNTRPSPVDRALLREEHIQVASAVRRHDRLDAEAAMLRHISSATQFQRSVLERWS